MNLIRIFISDDSYLLDRAIAEVMKDFPQSGFGDLNIAKLSARDVKGDEVVDQCNQLPMMGDKRLVLVKGAEDFDKADCEALQIYFKNPCPSTVLVLTASKLDLRTKIWKDSKSFINTLKKPYMNQVPAWLVGEARQKGLALSSDAATLLVDWMGDQLILLSMALGQLELYIAPRTQITLADVEGLLGDLNTKTVFDFVAKVGEKNLSESARLWEQMEKQGEAGVKLLFMLARHFRLLWMAKEGLDEGLSPETLSARLGVSPYFLKDYTGTARRMTQSSIQSVLKEILETDRLLKSSKKSDRALVQSLLVKHCLI